MDIPTTIGWYNNNYCYYKNPNNSQRSLIGTGSTKTTTTKTSLVRRRSIINNIRSSSSSSSIRIIIIVIIVVQLLFIRVGVEVESFLIADVPIRWGMTNQQQKIIKATSNPCCKTTSMLQRRYCANRIDNNFNDYHHQRKRRSRRFVPLLLFGHVRLLAAATDNIAPTSTPSLGLPLPTSINTNTCFVDSYTTTTNTTTTTTTTTTTSSNHHPPAEIIMEDDASNNKKNNDDNDDGVGLYIHLPFCRKRCRYCDFAIVPIGDRIINTTSSSSRNDDDDDDDDNDTTKYQHGVTTLMERYITTLCTEITTEIKKYKNNYNNNHSPNQQHKKIRLRSIYFGGGTPSLVPTELIRKVLETILSEDSIFQIIMDDDDTTNTTTTEITMEMDPGTFTQETVHELYGMGINRISLGIQSFNDTILQVIGRVHRRADIYQSIRYLYNVYGTTLNYSIDLITGLPGLSNAGWTETIDTAVHQLDPPPQHLSIYDLQIEQGTVFGKWYSSNRIDDDDDTNDDSVRKKSTSGGSSSSTHHQTVGNSLQQQELVLLSQTSRSINNKIPVPSLPSPDDCAFMYQYTSHYLRRNGYEHYEVSSYALLRSSSNHSLPSDNNYNNNTQSQSEAISSPALFGRPSYRSTHNQIYWGYNTEWYGFGLGATSCINGTLQARPRTMYDYEQWVEHEKNKVSSNSNNNNSNDPTHKELPSDDSSDLDILMDLVLKRLRTSEGLSLNYVRDRFNTNKSSASTKGRNIGDAYVTAILEGAQLGIELGLVEYDPTQQTLQLKRPRGFLFSNTIISSIFVAIEQVVDT